LRLKAVSSTIVTIMLVAATVACAAVVMYTFSTIPPAPQSSVPKTLISIIKISKESTGTYVYVYNYGETSDSISAVYVDGSQVSNFRIYTIDGSQATTILPGCMYKVYIGPSSMTISNEVDILLSSGDLLRYQVGK